MKRAMAAKGKGEGATRSKMTWRKTKKELGVKWERKYKIMSFKKITKIQLVIVIKGIY